MEIDISADGFLPTDTLCEHIRQCLDAAGRRVNTHVRALQVVLLPGTRVGDSGKWMGPKRCVLKAEVVDVGAVEVGARSYDLYEAVSRAVRRLRRFVTSRHPRSA